MSSENPIEVFGGPESTKPSRKAPRVKAPKAPKSSKAPQTPAGPTRKKGEVTGDVSEYPNYSAFKPTASLVPAYIRERRVNDKTMRITIFSCLGVLALILSLVGVTFFMALNAQGDRNDAQNSRQAAQVEADRLKPIATYYDGLKDRQKLATDAMATDLDRAKIINNIYASARGNVAITQVDISGQAPCQGPDPFDSIPALGCVTMTVNGSGTDVGAFVDELNKVAGFSSAYSESMFGDKSSGSPVTVNYSSDSLTMRFVPEAEREAARATIESQSAGETAGAPQ